MGYKNDLTNQRFGYLTVLEFAGNRKKLSMWKCVCDCGNTRFVSYPNLMSGNTKSCGCYNKQLNNERHIKGAKRQALIPKKEVKEVKKKGKQRLKNVWDGMLARCNDSSSPAYKHYGGRGIQVCKEWQDYECFQKWALENGYDWNAKAQQCTLERINVNGNYCPENCKLIPQSLQANNRRNNVYITFRGITKNIAEWAKETGMTYDTIRKRYVVRGWNAEKTLTTPTK